MRRKEYKGGNTITYALPVDGVSTIGIVVVLGTILPATNLSKEAVGISDNLLKALQGPAPVQVFDAELPNGGSVVFQARSQGKFSLQDMKPNFKKLGLNFNRLLACPVMYLFSSLIYSTFFCDN